MVAYLFQPLEVQLEKSIGIFGTADAELYDAVLEQLLDVMLFHVRLDVLEALLFAAQRLHLQLLLRFTLLLLLLVVVDQILFRFLLNRDLPFRSALDQH